MADMTDLEFDAQTEKPSEGFDLIPDGTYEAMVIESERKPTKANDGSEFLALTFQIIGPALAGRRLWHNLNLWHKTSPETVQISRGNLSAICRAVGVLKVKDSSELHNLPMLIKVGTEKRKDTGEFQNKIKDWKPKGGAATAPATAAKASGAPATAPAGVPWGQKATA